MVALDLHDGALHQGRQPQEGRQEGPVDGRRSGQEQGPSRGAPQPEAPQPQRRHHRPDHGDGVVGQEDRGRRHRHAPPPAPGRRPVYRLLPQPGEAGQEEGQAPQAQDVGHPPADVEVALHGVGGVGHDRPGDDGRGGLAPHPPGQEVDPADHGEGPQHGRPLHRHVEGPVGADEAQGGRQDQGEVVEPGGIEIESGVAVAPELLREPARVPVPPGDHLPQKEGPAQVQIAVVDLPQAKAGVQQGPPGGEGQQEQEGQARQPGRPGAPLQAPDPGPEADRQGPAGLDASDGRKRPHVHSERLRLPAGHGPPPVQTRSRARRCPGR